MMAMSQIPLWNLCCSSHLADSPYSEGSWGKAGHWWDIGRSKGSYFCFPNASWYRRSRSYGHKRWGKRLSLSECKSDIENPYQTPPYFFVVSATSPRRISCVVVVVLLLLLLLRRFLLTRNLSEAAAPHPSQQSRTAPVARQSFQSIAWRPSLLCPPSLPSFLPSSFPPQRLQS